MWLLILFSNLMQMPKYKKSFSKYYPGRKKGLILKIASSRKSEKLVAFDCTFKFLQAKHSQAMPSYIIYKWNWNSTNTFCTLYINTHHNRAIRINTEYIQNEQNLSLDQKLIAIFWKITWLDITLFSYTNLHLYKF